MKKLALFVVLVVGFLGGGCGGDTSPAPGSPAPGNDVVASTESSLTAGQFCTQPVDGQCLSPGYPVALTSYLCDPGTGTRSHQPEKLGDACGGQRPGEHPAVVPAEPRHRE